jgi:hypothetical protein
MDEIKELVEIKIGIYTGLYNAAKERGQEGVSNLYAQHLQKLKKLIKILTAIDKMTKINEIDEAFIPADQRIMIVIENGIIDTIFVEDELQTGNVPNIEIIDIDDQADDSVTKPDPHIILATTEKFENIRQEKLRHNN